MMHPNTRVPMDVFSRDNQYKINSYFRNVSVEHEIFHHTIDQIINYIQFPCDKLLTVVGPTGVGKTHLARKLIKRSLEVFPRNNKDSLVPVLYTSAQLPGTQFTWPDYFRATLEKFNVDTTITRRDKEVAQLKGHGDRLKLSGQSAYSLESELFKRFKDYGTQCLLIDEGAHIFRYSGKKGDLNLNTLKVLADTSDVRIIVFTLYDSLLSIGDATELNRRVKPFWFRPYDQDEIEFYSTYNALLENIPYELCTSILNGEDLVDPDFIFSGCLGCIGVLRDWIYDSLKHVANRSSKTLTKKDLEECRLPYNDRMELAKAIGAHRDYFDTGEESDILEALSGQLGKPINTQSKPTPNTKKKNKRKPGVQNPHRYPVS